MLSINTSATGRKMVLAGCDAWGFVELPDTWKRISTKNDKDGTMAYGNFGGSGNVSAIRISQIPASVDIYSGGYPNMEGKTVDEIIEIAGLPAGHIVKESNNKKVVYYSIQTDVRTSTEFVCVVKGDEGEKELEGIIETFMAPGKYVDPAGTQIAGDNFLGTLDMPTSLVLSAECLGSNPHMMQYDAVVKDAPFATVYITTGFEGTIDDFKTTEFYTSDAEGVRSEDMTIGGKNGYVITWRAPKENLYTSVYGIEQKDGSVVSIMVLVNGDDYTAFDSYATTYTVGMGDVGSL